jgi:isoquinoline 1-oxidoreductase beta subunit
VSPFKVSRRELLLVAGSAGAAGAAGLALGIRTGMRRERWTKRVPPREQPLAPSVYLAVGADGLCTVWVTRSEMGQGVRTALPMIVAEELDADWSQVRIAHPVTNGNYGSLATAASESVRGLWTELRQAGATARAMLVEAAAAAWAVPAAECRAEAGQVLHPATGRRLGYGALAERAATLPVPRKAPLKDRSSFRLLGRRTPRLDVPEKVDGSGVFGLDVRLPGLRYAAVARSPRRGGRVARFDAARAAAVPGVRQVLPVEGGVAVVADTTWAAFKGRDALDVVWEPGPHLPSTPEIAARLRQLARSGAGVVARAEGDPERELGSAPRRLELLYEVPLLAHAAMEPPNCTARVGGGRCEVWAPTQDPDAVRAAAARVTGLAAANVLVRTTLLGGGFGRRTHPDEAIEAVTLAHRTGDPVQVVWSREDDIRHDHYREAAAHALRVAADRDGLPRAWLHRIASPSLIGLRSGLDPIAVEGAADLPYTIPHLRVEWVGAELPVPVGIWRSVAHSHSAFAIECALDELAAQAGQDPLALRRRLLGGAPRLRACLERAAAAAGWGRPLPPGRGLGLAAHSCYGSHAAQVAEVEAAPDGALRVLRVVCAVDCGQTVNPETIEAQVEGGIAFGLGAALHGEITVEDGAVVQSNFTDYPLLRIDEMPVVEVHILDSDAPPGGVGELAVPPIAPAVANALFAATARRLRTLPLR